MALKPELPDGFGEIDELYKNIIKLELIVDAIRNVVSKGLLIIEEEEHVMLALNPSEIGIREMEAFGITDANFLDSGVQKRKIPALKGLVEKKLDETYDLVQKLENVTRVINNCQLDIPSKVAELQVEADASRDEVRKLYKRLKVLLRLHTDGRTSSLKKHLESLTFRANEIAANTGEFENRLLQSIFHNANEELLSDVEKRLETELAAVTDECDLKANKLKEYESKKGQLLPLANTLKTLNDEITVKKMALMALSG